MLLSYCLFIHLQVNCNNVSGVCKAILIFFYEQMEALFFFLGEDGSCGETVAVRTRTGTREHVIEKQDEAKFPWRFFEL